MGRDLADKLLDAVQKYYLTDTDLKNLTGNRCTVLSYSQLKDILNIDELFYSAENDTYLDACILLYEEKKDSGHWVVLLKRDRSIEIFDPYGMKFLDEQLKFSNYNKEKYLSKLFKKSNRRYSFNTEALQITNKNMNTCGRWVSIRVLFHTYNNDKFIKFWHDLDVITPDDKIALCSLILDLNHVS